MLHQLHNMSREQHFILACSGGVDSMAIADFYLRGGKHFSVAYFHHGTPQADQMNKLVFEWASNNHVPFLVGDISSGSKPPELSPEEHWRNERYAWLHSFQMPVVTCHHANDQMENWIFSCLHGNPKLIKSYLNVGDGLYRPFLTNTKQQLIDWCVQHHVKWFEDSSNMNTHFPRNRIRHNMLPEVLKINPGFLKVIRKKTIEENDGKIY